MSREQLKSLNQEQNETHKLRINYMVTKDHIAMHIILF